MEYCIDGDVSVQVHAMPANMQWQTLFMIGQLYVLYMH